LGGKVIKGVFGGVIVQKGEEGSGGKEEKEEEETAMKGSFKRN